MLQQRCIYRTESYTDCMSSSSGYISRGLGSRSSVFHVFMSLYVMWKQHGRYKEDVLYCSELLTNECSDGPASFFFRGCCELSLKDTVKILISDQISAKKHVEALH